MLEGYANYIFAGEILVFLAGFGLLWRQGLSPEARKSSPALPFWDIKASDFLQFIWLVVCVGLVAQLIAVPLVKLAGRSPTATLILTGSAFHVGMLAGALIHWQLRKSKDIPAPAPAKPVNVVLAGFATFALALPLVMATSLAWQFLLKAAGYPAQPQDLIALFADAKSIRLLLLMVGVATLLAPVTEELVFRAGFFRYCRGRLPRWVALVLPSALFAALHANLASFVPLAVLGVIFSLAYERTNRIAVPIIAHALFNLNTIVLILAGVGP